MVSGRVPYPNRPAASQKAAAALTSTSQADLIVRMASFSDLSKSQGLDELDQYLLTRSYITGYVSDSDAAFYSTCCLRSRTCSNEVEPKFALCISQSAQLLSG